MSFRIPFNKPFIVGKELYYIAQSVLQLQTSGDGVYTKKSQQLMKDTFGAQDILLTTSCTAALDLAAILSDVKEGEEVILPSFTFSSTANAFLLRGARLVFVDCRRDTMNIDETLLEAAISEKTRIIVPVHYAGVACEMDTIAALAKKYRLTVIEDAAQGVNAKYKNRYLGTIGDIGTYSFHETKNFTCGEGGALLINDPAYIERAEVIREKGTNRNRFFRGQVDKYTWVDIGSSFLPSDLLAAFLYGQLEARERIQARRREIWTYYYDCLHNWVHENDVRLPIIPVDCEQTYHMFYLLLPSLERRQSFISHLKANGIYSVFHYLPLHLSEMGQRLGGKHGQCPVTEDLSDRLVRLPFYYALTPDDQMKVVQAVYQYQIDP